MTALAPILQAFFTDRLMTQRAAASHTIASYRDTLRLLLGYVHDQTGKQPAQLDLADLDAVTVGAFLAHLETARGNSAATRNNRLAAIHSLFRYAALKAPDQMDTISRVLAIQAKRTATTIVSYLAPAELDAVLAAPDQATWHGRRDHALLVLAAQTGLRVSEITGLAIHDAHLGTGAHVYCRGKGRKDRCTPLTSHTTGILAEWTAERSAPPEAPLLCTRSGTPMSADAVARLTSKYAATGGHRMPDAGHEEDHPAHHEAHRSDEPPPRRSRHHRHRALARSRKPRRPPGSTCTPT